MEETVAQPLKLLDPRKFRDSWTTADGEPRASVHLVKLETLWFCTGTLCNLTCEHCYIESSPTNDSLVYISVGEVAAYLDEIEREGFGTQTIAFTGGEPFMNPDMVPILDEVLRRGYEVMVLTNAMKPMMKVSEPLLEVHEQYGDRLTMRISIDHYSKDVHEQERGKRSWDPAIQGMQWLSDHGFHLDIAGRLFSGETEEQMRAGFARLFAREGIQMDAWNRHQLVLFPEMDERVDVPEITTDCWRKLKVSPDDQMCASSRMVIKRKGADHPVVVPCTLLPYQPEFELGQTLSESFQEVPLNHPHCAKFCVLGGASCSG